MKKNSEYYLLMSSLEPIHWRCRRIILNLDPQCNIEHF